MKALQGHISNLRKQLGRDRIVTRAPGYSIVLEPDELDLERFERLARDGDPQALVEALALWRGPPLADFAGSRFALSEIERLDERRLTVLEARIESDLALGRHADLVAELDALVAQYPLRERLRAQLMLALYRSGRQAEALEAYQGARRTLVEEIGIEPRRALRDLHQQILNQHSSLEQTTSAAAEDGAEGGRGIFVGRVRELADVSSALDDALAAQGGLVFLVGEPGIGKSRLAEELMRKARAEGAMTLVGRCWEVGGAPAYWPWVQSLRSYIRSTPPARLREELGPSAAELAQLLPELRELFDDLPEPALLDAESARFRLFEAVTNLIRNAATTQALVLVLDDLHAADEPSLLLLRFLGRELSGTRVLVIAACRNVDPSPSDPLTTTLTELAREPVTRMVLLRGLSEDDVRGFLELTTGESPSESLVAAIHEETEGNPLFVGEIVRLLSAEGRLTADEPPQLAIPQSVRDVIARRLRRLSPECLALLTLASVLGREFSLPVLARAAAASDDDVLDTLDEAMRERVVTDVPSVPSGLRFAHVLIRDTLYEELTPARRIRLHRQAVQALEDLYGEGSKSALTELAHHSIAGSDFARGVRYARSAGDRALDQLAYEEAARLYHSALETLELTEGGGDDRTRCELLLSLGDAQGKAGNTPESKETLLAAAEIARSAGLPEHLARAALGYGGRFPWLRAGDDRRLVPLLEEALAGLGEEESELRVRLLARLGGALRDQPSLEPRSSLSREAVAIARRLGNPDTLGYALVSLATATWSPDIEELIPYVDEVKRLAEETGDLERMFQWGWLYHIVCMNLGDIASAEEIAVTHRALAWELNQRSQQWYSTVMRSLIPLIRGDFAAAEELAGEALQIGQRAQNWDAEFSHRVLLFAVRREQGRLEEVDQLIRSSVADYPGYRAFRCLTPLVECELGRDDAARTGFEELAAGDFSGLPRDSEWVFNLCVLAQVAVHLDDRARAATLYDLLLPYEQRNAALTGEIAFGSVSRYLGLLAALLGRLDEAEAHFEQALAMNERMNARPALAHTQDDYAHMLAQRGDTHRSSQLIAAALSTYHELGMNGHAARANELLARLPSSADPHG